MKVLALFAFLLTLTISWSQNTIYWSPPIEISGLSESHRPRVELLSDNTPVVIWAQFTPSSDKDYYFSKWENNGFLPPFQLNHASVLTYDWGGTEFATNGDTIYTVYKTENVTTGRVYMRKSIDGGINWEPEVVIEDLQGELAMYPGIEAYDGNKVLITYMTHGPNGVNPQYIVRNSSDAGATFSSGTSVSADFGEEACYCCPPAIVGNTDYQVMSFRNDENNIRDMKAGVSTNGGTTFDTQISLDDHNWLLTSCPATGGDVVLNDSQLYSTYMNMGGGDAMIYFAEDDLSDGNIYTAAPAVDIDSATNMNHPHLTNLGDSVLLVWQQSSGSEMDIWYNFSFDGMNDWEASAALPVFEMAGMQSKPDVVIGTDGSMHLVYHDFDADKIMYTKGTFSMVGIEEEKLASFSIYPNPATLKLTLAGVPDNVSYLIFDMLGNEILRGTGNEVNIEGLSSGVYTITIEGRMRQSFIVE